MQEVLDELQERDLVKEGRRCGMVAGIELATDRSGAVGKAVCAKLREKGMLTRPILDTIVWMPPLASTEEEIREMGAMLKAVL